MITLAKFMIIVGVDNRPPMLEKSLYASWKSRMELYMENRENGRMILDSILNGLLVWPTVVQEDGTTRKKTYAELSATKKIQAECDLKTTNIVLQGLPPDILPPEWNKFVTDVKLDRDLHTTNYDQLYSYLKQHEAHANETRLMRERYQDPLAFLLQGSLQPTINFELPLIRETRPLFKMVGLQCNKFKGGKDKVMLVLAIRVKDTWQDNALSLSDQGMLHDLRKRQCWLKHMNPDLDAYDSDCDDVSNAKVVLMANLSNCGSDVISEVSHSEPYHNDMDNQSVHAMQDFKQTPIIDFSDNEITSDSNIILYSQYFQETQQAAVQDTNLHAQQDSMILFAIEQMSEQMINHMIDSQMYDMIKENLALKQQIDSLEQNLSNQIKEKESLLQTFTVLKNESKEKENKYMENEIDLEKKIKELDNIVYKVSQSAQTVHMLTKA
ncbi:hypothetical protein Tco_0732822 [Tanacetum coccineum]